MGGILGRRDAMRDKGRVRPGGEGQGRRSAQLLSGHPCFEARGWPVALPSTALRVLSTCAEQEWDCALWAKDRFLSHAACPVAQQGMSSLVS